MASKPKAAPKALAPLPAIPAGWIVCGADEVGRGPLAGPVVAAAAILDPSRPIKGLADSKALSEKARDALEPLIRERALAFAIASATVEEIDALNILNASMLAMRRAIEALSAAPQLALIDGNRIPKGLLMPAHAIVKGDARVAEISAASILAKVSRDALMRRLAQEHPGYGLEVHMGYPTPAHLAALESLGASPIHRRSFGPVRAALGLPDPAKPARRAPKP